MLLMIMHLNLLANMNKLKDFVHANLGGQGQVRLSEFTILTYLTLESNDHLQLHTFQFLNDVGTVF